MFVGGRSEHALRRAAAHDGWIGDLMRTADALAIAARLRELRTGAGKSMDDFTVLAPIIDSITIEDYARAEEGGITHILTMPWMFYSSPDASTADKIRGMERFRADLQLTTVDQPPPRAASSDDRASSMGTRCIHDKKSLSL